MDITAQVNEDGSIAVSLTVEESPTIEGVETLARVVGGQALDMHCDLHRVRRPASPTDD